MGLVPRRLAHECVAERTNIHRARELRLREDASIGRKDAYERFGRSVGSHDEGADRRVERQDGRSR
jgi:hypothetical protein